MLLTDFNFGEEDDSTTADSAAEAARSRQRGDYVPLMCGSENDFADDVNGIKARADLLFYRKEFPQCLELYNRHVLINFKR